ncbi:E3 ubiquitin-protein ligase ATL6-like [Tasmannia lanceolata]|uniref:E3 ubiquitin-protein ligase ATL6-like n=1 Tax=Tasmannia lanceolata TaxID=3420 RepID=UPI004063C81F
MMMKKKSINQSRPIHGFIYLMIASLALAQSDPPPTPYGVHMRFTPSIAIIVVVLISSFFLMGIFSICLRNYVGERSLRGGSARGMNQGRSRRGLCGLDRSVIETFPTFEYSVVKGLKLGKGTLECAVCLSEFEDEETLRLLPKCDHVFHPDCIDAWLASHTTCPVCRSNLVPESETDPVATPDSDDPVETELEGDNHEHEITITVDPLPELIDPTEIPIQNRTVRSRSSKRSWFSGRFPRSHSTGHSLIQPGENVERFTLRLPEHIRREIVKGKLKRTFENEGGVSDGSVKRGGGEGRSIRRFDRRWESDRWGFSRAQGFFSRTFSIKSPKISADGEPMATTPKTLYQSVKTPFDCLGSKAEADGQSSAHDSATVSTVSHQPA